MSALWASKVEHHFGFGREELAEVTFEASREDVVVERTKAKSAVDGSPLRCWGMRWLGDETCSNDGIPAYRFEYLEIGYLICPRHAMTWRETYTHHSRDPYTITSWSGFSV